MAVAMPVGGRKHERAGEQRGDGNRGGVVEETLALDQADQALGCATVAKERDDGGRVRRADDRAEQQADDQALAAAQPRGKPDACRRSHHRADREEQDGGEIGEKAARVDLQRRLEEDGRQEDPEIGFRRHGGRHKGNDGRCSEPGREVLQREVSAAEQHARAGQAERIGETESLRDAVAERDDE
jgi:hypothetical protein